jgi:arylsulfatase A-like enzyme
MEFVSSTMKAAPLFAFLILLALQGPLQAERLPNIVWIIGENLCLDLACHGQENVKTPHLDRLATAGVNYTNVYATGPVCATSRSAFMTGMYATTTDTHHMRSHREDDYRLPPGVRPIMHRLKDVGYRTGNIKTIGDKEVGTGKLDLNFVNEGPLYDTEDWAALTEGDAPFFATINTPETEYDIYDRKTWEKPRAVWVGEEYHEQVATPENVTPPPYYPDHPVVREEWARYLNSVSGIDVRVGTILEALKRQGLEKDTIVIFFGDNGRLEARGIHWCWDMGIHVPMIIHWPENFPQPEGFQPGTVNDQVISLIDLTATTLSFAGIVPPIGMQGRAFLGKNAGPQRSYAFSARDRIDETVNRIRSVRDKRFHYIRNFMPQVSFLSLNRYKEKCFLVKPLMREMLAKGELSGAPLNLMAERLPEEELYDTANDPHELNNLAKSNDPDHVAALHRMRAALDTWMIETGDRGHVPEAEDIVAPFEKEMHDWFGTPEWAQP